jgi:acetyl-CoA synthetase
MAFGSEFEQARDFLILYRADYAYAHEHFRWPERTHFNWALDYFDSMAEGNNNTALWVVGEGGARRKHLCCPK